MPTAERRSVLARFYVWLALGFTPLEAANLLGWQVGLWPAGWSEKQVARFLFLAYLYRRRDPTEL